jgi:galactose mutarotase-like enzyme
MILLRNHSCQVAVAPQRGAIVTSLSVDGQEVLYFDQSTFDDPDKNVRGGVPVLFPICGPLAEASYEWSGVAYSMKQHGFARNLPWTVVEQSDDRTTLQLTDSQATRDQYPFAFSYQIVYSALPDGLRVEQVIENRGDEPMPAQFGFHPYFVVGDKRQLSFDLPVASYSDNKSDAHGPFPGFDFGSDEIDWAFLHPTARQASFTDPTRGVRVTVSYGEAYQLLVFWTLKDSPFVCVEPWSSSRLAFPQGKDVHRIGPRTSLTSSVELVVESVKSQQ